MEFTGISEQDPLTPAKNRDLRRRARIELRDQPAQQLRFFTVVFNPVMTGRAGCEPVGRLIGVWASASAATPWSTMVMGSYQGAVAFLPHLAVGVGHFISWGGAQRDTPFHQRAEPGHSARHDAFLADVYGSPSARMMCAQLPHLSTIGVPSVRVTQGCPGFALQTTQRLASAVRTSSELRSRRSSKITLRPAL